MTGLLRKTTDGGTRAGAPEPAQEALAPDTAEGSVVRDTADSDTSGPPDTGAGAAEAADAAADPARAADADGAGGEDGGDGGDGDERADPDVRGSGSGPRSGGRWRTAAFAAAVAVLLLAGSALFYGAHQLRSTPSAQNRALTDTAATDRVSGEVGDGLARIFSYTPTGADATERSARTVLGGRAARQYADLFAQLRANLEKQKITLNTQAVRTGVIELDGDTARLLVLLDQTSRRDEGSTTSAAAQLTVTARLHDNRWQIVDIKAR
ncbi:hypothetical protein AB0P12_10475 [Streptomyces subrutilus]|uniref:hypothetical protein n=1 Tax=Streptomyces subrutilus TaxID=36818 RepID=UPI0033C1C003